MSSGPGAGRRSFNAIATRMDTIMAEAFDRLLEELAPEWRADGRLSAIFDERRELWLHRRGEDRLRR